MTSSLSMTVKWNTYQICLDMTWQECMSSFLSFIFVIRICDFAAKEACNVVEKWKWNCVGYVQFPLTEWHQLYFACSLGKLTTASASKTQALTLVKTTLLNTSNCSFLFCVIQMCSGNHNLESGDCQRIIAIHMWMISRGNIFVFNS